MIVFIDTWVLVELYKKNPAAIALVNAVKRNLKAPKGRDEAAKEKLELHISQLTMTELLDVITKKYGERTGLTQYALLKHSPLIRHPITEDITKEAGLYKAKYGLSLEDGIILATALRKGADLFVTGKERDYEEKWRKISEIKVMKLSDFAATLPKEESPKIGSLTTE